jgi:hypothetical protein
MINIHGFKLKTKMTEYTLLEFQNISKILNDNLDEVDKYLKILEILGMPEDVLYDIDSEELIYIVKEFRKDTINNKDLTRTIEMNGFTYESYIEGGEFKLKAKDFALIETLIKKSPDAFLVEAIAIIFKNTTLTKTEHFTKAHIDYKKRLFNDLIADQYYQYIVYINTMIVNKIKLLND